MRAGYVTQPNPVPLLLAPILRRRHRRLAGLGITSAECGARGWNGTGCTCQSGQVAQEGGACYTPPAPVSCPSLFEALVSTTNFPQGICVPGDVDFSNPSNAYLGQLIAVLQGHLVAASNPLQLITTVYGPLTPGTTGSGVTPLPQRTPPAIQMPGAPAPSASSGGSAASGGGTTTGTGGGSTADGAPKTTTGPGPATGFQPLQTIEGFLTKPLFDGVPVWGALVAALVGGGLLLSRRR